MYRGRPFNNASEDGDSVRAAFPLSADRTSSIAPIGGSSGAISEEDLLVLATPYPAKCGTDD